MLKIAGWVCDINGSRREEVVVLGDIEGWKVEYAEWKLWDGSWGVGRCSTVDATLE